MAFLPRPVTMMIFVSPAATASSTTYWMIGLSTSGSISLGWAFVAGRKRVPRPAAGKTALRIFIGRFDASTAAVLSCPLPEEAFVLDLRFVVENRERVLEMLRQRGLSVDQVLAQGDPWALDEERRSLIQRVEQLRHRQRLAGEEIARRGKAGQDAADLKAEMKGVADEIKQLEARLQDVQARLDHVLLLLPKLPHPSAPVGADASANLEVRRVGEPKRFDFTPKAHWDLGPELGILDFDRAAKISGARFAVYFGAGARLERALIQFMLDLHTKQRGYREVIPPYLVTAETLVGTGQLPKFEADLFRTRAGDRDLYLIPTAEAPLTAPHRDQILAAAD